MYQFLMLSMNLALLSNNIGLMWVAVEAATLTTVVMVGIYRTPAALEAAWKYFILGSVGIALALFGTILVYLAAQPVARRGPAGHGLEPARGELGGLRPGAAQPRLRVPAARLRHQDRPGTRCTPGCRMPTPRARRRSRRCCPACCSTSRCSRCCASSSSWPGNAGVLAPGPLMMTMGLVSLIFAGLMMYRRRDIKRLFAYSSIEHMGIITFAFGLGGPLANFAGLLHMAMHSLTKSAIFFGVGYVSQLEGTQNIADIRGLTQSAPLLGWILVDSRGRHRGPAALRRLHQRVPHRHLDLRPLALAGTAAGGGPRHRLRRADAAAARNWPSARRRSGTCCPHGDWRRWRCTSRWSRSPGVFIPEPIVVWFRHVAQVLGG